MRGLVILSLILLSSNVIHGQSDVTDATPSTLDLLEQLEVVGLKLLSTLLEIAIVYIQELLDSLGTTTYDPTETTSIIPTGFPIDPNETITTDSTTSDPDSSTTSTTQNGLNDTTFSDDTTSTISFDTTTPSDTTTPDSTTPDITTTPDSTTPDITTTPDSTTPDVTTPPDSTTPDVTTSPNSTTPDVTTSPNSTTPDVTTSPNSTTPDVTTSTYSVTTPGVTTSKNPLTTSILDYDYYDPLTVAPPAPQRCSTNGEKFPDVTNCKHYKMCINHKIMSVACEANGYYNCYSNRCGLIKYGSCCSEDPSGSKYCNINGVKISLPDPSRYLECVNNRIVTRQCPGSMKFDPATSLCN